jgi:hypothetical protein
VIAKTLSNPGTVRDRPEDQEYRPWQGSGTKINVGGISALGPSLATCNQQNDHQHCPNITDDAGLAGGEMSATKALGDAMDEAGAFGKAVGSAGDDVVEFVHATSVASGEDIVQNGLSEEAARAAADQSGLGTKRAGSWFTVPVDPADPDGAVIAAQGWLTRQQGKTCIVTCALPRQLVDDLRKAGLMTETIIPRQAVFDPAAFAAINRVARWRITRIR